MNEEEIAVIALGSDRVWAKQITVNGTPAEYYATPMPGGSYVVWRDSEHHAWQAMRWQNWQANPSPEQFSTLQAGKAACERHHATGKWE